MHIAMEIDQPFGADANDLPIKAAWMHVFAVCSCIERHASCLLHHQAMMKDYNRR